MRVLKIKVVGELAPLLNVFPKFVTHPGCGEFLTSKMELYCPEEIVENTLNKTCMRPLTGTEYKMQEGIGICLFRNDHDKRNNVQLLKDF